MRGRKRKLNIKRVIIVIILFSLIIAGGCLIFNKYFSKTNKTKEVKSVDTIEGYGYNLKAKATSYYKSLFKKLDKVLSEDNIDEEKYAELVSQMFIADFFNLDNKTSKNDIGGTEFVYSSYVTDFKKYAMEGMYKSVESNVYGNRKQDLPVVKNVTVTKVEQSSYKYGDNTDEKAYVYNFEIEYETDLSYQTKGSLILIHNDKKLEVASMSEKEK